MALKFVFSCSSIRIQPQPPFITIVENSMNSKHKELSVRQNMIWNMAGSIIGMACQWLISIIVVRLAADMSSAGLYSLAMSVFAIFSPIANFGMYTYIVTDMEDRNTSGEYITISLFTSLAAIIVTTAYAAVTCRPTCCRWSSPMPYTRE